tara:strand:+ start:4500 stop:6386 length:1887 start_codon:yes stop_codon:yes gene_type:complete
MITFRYHKIFSMEPGDSKKIKTLIRDIDLIIASCKAYEVVFATALSQVHPNHYHSAVNLVHYLAYRNSKTSKIKLFLYNKGLYALKNTESHIMAGLLAAKTVLHQLNEDPIIQIPKPPISIKKSIKLLRKNRRELLGKRTKKRAARIMVTQPPEAATNPDLAYNMMQCGMNNIRINCAHNSPAEWLKMITNAKISMKKFGKEVKITMDLGGPKIRTGPIAPGPRVIHLAPKHNQLGEVLFPARAALFPSEEFHHKDNDTYIPIPFELIQKLKVGDRLLLKDTRGKKRYLKVIEVDKPLVWVNSYKNTYIQTGTLLYLERDNKKAYEIGKIPPLEQYITLKKGDIISIHKEQVLGEPAIYDKKGNLIQHAKISCTHPAVFKDVKEGQTVFFDDGKIEGIIREHLGNELIILIVYAKENGNKLKADKGINFPKSNLSISGLTCKDKEDLKFVVQYADVVNMSFVNTPEDVEELMKTLSQLNALNSIGVIIKIETMSGFRNIVKILLTAMQMKHVGVMLARGDLAIECGWENVGIVQKELLKICHAAHVPTVWATQVLENLAKKGIPSRAEITDAVSAQGADCVMLNKGPYILKAIELLDCILLNLEKLRNDKRAFFKKIAGVKPETGTRE